jgi:ParB/RepB/Spo0J family partition protein
LRAKNGPFPVDTECCDVWVGNTRDLATLNPGRLSSLVDSIREEGQHIAAIARVAPYDPSRLEIIAGACRMHAIRIINETLEPSERLKLTVHLLKLSDDQAYRIVSAENRDRSAMTAVENAALYEQAIEKVFGTEVALAEALRLNKSNVNRTLAIRKLPAEVLALIKNPHAISAAQASGFMADWGKAELRETLEAMIVALAEQDPASASSIFKALSAAVAPPHDEDDVAIEDERGVYGSLRRRKSEVIIKLGSNAKDVQVVRLINAMCQALRSIGFIG